MSIVTVLFALASALAVFVIAAVVVGREAQRLDMVAPRVIYDIDQAAEYVVCCQAVLKRDSQWKKCANCCWLICHG